MSTWLESLKVGDQVVAKSASNKHIEMPVVAADGRFIITECSGQQVKWHRNNGIRVGDEQSEPDWWLVGPPEVVAKMQAESQDRRELESFTRQWAWMEKLSLDQLRRMAAIAKEAKDEQ